MADVPEAAVQAALAAVPRWYREHARESVQHYPSHGLVRAMIAAAAPLIRAGERERIALECERRAAASPPDAQRAAFLAAAAVARGDYVPTREAQERSDEKGAGRA